MSGNMNSDDFIGKTALITGAGSGIGRELAKKLVSLGARVIAVSQTYDKLASLKPEVADSSRLDIIAVDLANWTETEQKLTTICSQVDLLVNNAGYSHNCGIEDVLLDELNAIYDVNLKAPINLIRLVSRGMKERRQGSIVNVSSVAGLAALDQHVGYASSKAGLDMVTKVCAKELGPFDVRVNSVNPTVVWTKMGRDFWSDEAKKAPMIAKIPLGRFAEIDEVIEPILFLLGNKSSMINGISLPIDGGFVAC